MKRTTWIWMSAGMALAAAGYWGATQRAAVPAQAAGKHDQAKTARPVVAAGLVEPASEEIRLGAQMDGVLRSVLVEEGDAVKRGQIVAVLENGEYSARVVLARSRIAEAEATLERLRNGSRQQERREADANVREAQVALEIARAERERRHVLLERGAVSRSEYDLSDRDYRTAAARLDALRERAALVHDATRAEDLARAEAELATARAQLNEALAMLEKTMVRAPIDGRILRKIRKAGEAVSANGSTPIVSLGDLSELRVRVDVDETDVAKLREGMPAYVRAEAYGDRQFAGRVVRIGQALGRKNVRTDEPTERVDRKILETLITLDPGAALPVGLRVDAYLLPE
jgi:ABC exporter DevB family membrane fusion protein